MMRWGALGEKPSLIKDNNLDLATQMKCPQWSNVHTCHLHLPCLRPGFDAQQTVQAKDLIEVLAVLALGWTEHQWAQATFHQETQKKTCPVWCQGMAQLFLYFPDTRETSGSSALLPTPAEDHLWNVDDTFNSLWLSRHWHMILSNLFPGEDPVSAITRRECRTQPTFSSPLRNKAQSLVVTPPNPNLLVSHFLSLAENTRLSCTWVTGFILFWWLTHFREDAAPKIIGQIPPLIFAILHAISPV